MPRTLSLVCIVCSLLVFASPTVVAAQDGPSLRPMLPGRVVGKTPAAPRWNAAECVFVGKLDSVVAGPVGQSMPPMYTHRLSFTVGDSIRGGLKPGAKIECSNVARQMKEPTFPEGKSCLVAASKARGTMRIMIIEEAKPEKVKQVQLDCSLPMGWKADGGNVVSPFAKLGATAWLGRYTGDAPGLTCSKTGRPALLAGAEVTFAVEPVPPAKAIKWTNPDGDGEYKVTVTNNTGETLLVPALLNRDGKILWEDSLLIVCQKKVYVCPGAKGVADNVGPTQLKPGESVSTTVNAFRLDGPEWPRGGYRIEFQFCLAELSQTKSFYYMSRHHDKLRDAVSGK